MYAGIKVRVRRKKSWVSFYFHDLCPLRYSTPCKTITVTKSALHCGESEFLSLNSVTPATSTIFFLSSKWTRLKSPEIASGFEPNVDVAVFIPPPRLGPQCVLPPCLVFPLPHPLCLPPRSPTLQISSTPLSPTREPSWPTCPASTTPSLEPSRWEITTKRDRIRWFTSLMETPSCGEGV